MLKCLNEGSLDDVFRRSEIPRLSHHQGVHRPLVPLNERFKCVFIARKHLPDKYAVCSDHKFPAFRDRPGFIDADSRINFGSYHDSGARDRILKKYPFKVCFCSDISGSVRHNGKLGNPRTYVDR